MAADEPPNRPPSNPDYEEEPKSRTGRFQVQHRGGTHVEVGEPIFLGGDKPWMCAVKLVGRKRDLSEDNEPTQTLLLRTGRGDTAEDARREALSALTLVYGSPVEPPPATLILQKPSDPPPSPRPPIPVPAPAEPPRSWWSRLVGRLRGS